MMLKSNVLISCNRDPSLPVFSLNVCGTAASRRANAPSPL
jgi:hypothetical protein